MTSKEKDLARKHCKLQWAAGGVPAGHPYCVMQKHEALHAKDSRVSSMTGAWV